MRTRAGLGALVALALLATAASPVDDATRRGAEVLATARTVVDPIRPVVGPHDGLAPVLQAGGAFTTASPADDLDGDGVADLQAWDPWTDGLTAAAATTGNRLVAPTVPGEGRQVAVRRLDVDVTGDGRPDVLRLAVASRTEERSCGTFGACDLTVRWTWVLSAHTSLASGPSWTHRVPAGVDARDTGTAPGLAPARREWTGLDDRFEARVASVGGRGVVLATVVSTAGWYDHVIAAVQVVGGRPQYRVTPTAARVTSLAASGAPAITQQLVVGPGREEYVPLGDLDLDGLADLVLVVPDGTRGERVGTVVDAWLARRWAVSLHPTTALRRAPAGPDGFSRVLRSSPGTAVMHDGETGAVAWDSPQVRLAAGHAKGFLTATAWQVVEPDRASDPRSVGIRLGRFDLADGRFRGFDVRYQMGDFEGASLPQGFAGADVDGDGVLDLTGQELRLDGTDGRLLDVTATGRTYVGPSNPPAGPWLEVELDGLPGTEQLWVEYDRRADVWDDVIARRPGQRMWRVPRRTYDAWVPVRVGGTTAWADVWLDGGGRPHVRLLDGVTLDVRWTSPVGATGGGQRAEG